jgi:hypothetical protein
MSKTKNPGASTKETNNRRKTLEPHPRPKNDAARSDDVIKLRIDGLSAKVTPKLIRDFCAAFGKVSGLRIESDSDGNHAAFVDLVEPQEFEELGQWVGWLNPRKIKGWLVQVESDESMPEGPRFSSWLR